MTKARASTVLDEATERLQPFQDDPLRAAFLARGIQVLARVAERLDQGELGRAVASPSNEGTLMSALTQPGAIGLFADDPRASTRLLGLEARDALLVAEGGTLSAEEVGAQLGVSRQAVDKRRRAGRLLAVETGRRGYLYPAWQLADAGVLPGIEETLVLLAGQPPLERLGFFLHPSRLLGGERPLDRLRRGDLAPVLVAARAFGAGEGT
jgi:biotin operon repressor